jgi:hypothetical protein
MRTSYVLPIVALPLLTAGLATVSGCGGKTTTVDNNSQTTGKALQDLDDAKAKGLLSDSEYKEQRKKILKGD